MDVTWIVPLNGIAKNDDRYWGGNQDSSVREEHYQRLVGNRNKKAGREGSVVRGLGSPRNRDFCQKGEIIVRD